MSTREDDVEEVEVTPIEEISKHVKRHKIVKAARAKMKAKAKAKTNGKMKKAKTGKMRKPRVRDPAKLDAFGFRKGTLKSRAALMYAKPKGATLQEVKGVLKSTQFNLISELEGKGYKIKREQVSGDHDRKVTRFHIMTR